MKQMLNAAIKLAAIWHDGQYDKAGNPYILHVLKVMHYLKSDDEELNCIAVLHDIIEDCEGVNASSLYNAGMSQRVVQGVMKLTKTPGQTKEEYQAEVFSSVDAMLVKRCDLRHNMDIRRLKGLRQKDFERMAAYAEFYTKIDEKLKEIRLT